MISLKAFQLKFVFVWRITKASYLFARMIKIIIIMIDRDKYIIEFIANFVNSQ